MQPAKDENQEKLLSNPLSSKEQLFIYLLLLLVLFVSNSDLTGKHTCHGKGMITKDIKNIDFTHTKKTCDLMHSSYE